MKIAIYAWAGMGNLGDDWLLENAVLQAEQLGAHVTLLLETRAKAPRSLAGRPTLHWPRGRELALRSAGFYRTLNQHHAVLLAGGGWLASDQGIREPMIWAARLAQVRTTIASHGLGVGPFPTRVGRIIGREVLRQMGRVTPVGVRALPDGVSIASVGIDEFSIGTDLAFLAEPQLPKLLDSPTRRLAVSLPPPSRRWLEQPESWADRFASIVLEKFGRDNVSFVSFQNGQHDDAEYWQRHFSAVVRPTTIDDALSVLSEHTHVVAGRLHAALASAMAGVPEIMPLAYHHKFSLLQEIGLKPVSWQRFGQDSLFSSVNRQSLHDICYAGRRQFADLLEDVTPHG